MPPFAPRYAPVRREAGTSVYVRGFADDVGDVRLREVFQPYGRIMHAKVSL